MRYGYARVSTDGQSVDAQVRQLTKAGCEKVFREVASGAKTDRAQLRRGSGKNLGRYAASWIACWPKRPSSTAART